MIPKQLLRGPDKPLRREFLKFGLHQKTLELTERDIGTSLPELLKAMIAVMPPPTMLRLGMTNPPYILEHLDAMVDILNHPRVYAFLHVPV
jgi:tRNA A37 methylthiotransferase MiaB